ncbi:hypothetical protein [Ruegeria sp. SCP11]|uniref:hypothetical protein n=1 Tax=Ruegeria sp. SCP11 TaxID=3141378 RepID=UPI0033394F0F
MKDHWRRKSPFPVGGGQRLDRPALDRARADQVISRTQFGGVDLAEITRQPT